MTSTDHRNDWYETVSGTFRYAAIVGALFLPLAGATQEENATFADALTDGEANFDVRYRYEFVDDDDFAENANASTARLRLNYQTESWQNWSGFVEFDYIGEILIADFNSGGGTSSPDRDQYPIVADPKGADLNQLYVDYTGFPDARLRIGRQRIVLDNQRFVGGVAWRQNEQTYDALSFRSKLSPDIDLFYAYVGQVNRIFGERSAAGSTSSNTHLLNVNFKASDNWSFVPYYYRIDDDDIAAFSTSTLGIRALGKLSVGSKRLDIVAELASQTDAANNPVDYDALYYHLSADLQISESLTVGADIESLGGDQQVAGSAFRTPLATLHLFQGWADQLLLTPAAGVNDYSLRIAYTQSAWRFQGRFHSFQAEDGPGDWGDELEFSGSRNFGERYTLLLKAAVFSASDPAFSDATKFWIQFQARY